MARGHLPTALNLLFLASMVVLAGGVAGALYGWFLGIPVSFLNLFLLPTVFGGLGLLLVASAWRRRLDDESSAHRSGNAETGHGRP